MSFYCQIVSGPGLIPIVKQLFRAIDCTHHTITNETIAEDQAIFQKCVGKLQHAPMVVTQERDYGNTACLQESKWICSSSNGSALTGFMNDSVTFGNVTTSTVNAVETGGLLNNLYGETVWRMDSNECVECWTWYHIKYYGIWAFFGAFVLVIFCPRLVTVDYHLSAIELTWWPLWKVVDTSNDATPQRSAEHPFSSNNLQYDKWVIVVKITLLFFTVFLGNFQGGLVAAWAVLFGGIVLLLAGLRYPPYYHQRGRRWVDPNSFQTGLDASMVWLYIIGLMATKATLENGGDERVLESGDFVWMPYGVFVVFVVMWWLRLKGVFDFVEVGIKVGWHQRNKEGWFSGGWLTQFVGDVFIERRWWNDYSIITKILSSLLILLLPIIILIILIWFPVALCRELYFNITTEKKYNKPSWRIGRVTREISNPCNWSKFCSCNKLKESRNEGTESCVPTSTETTDNDNETTVKVNIRMPRRRKSKIIQTGKIKFSKLKEEEEENIDGRSL